MDIFSSHIGTLCTAKSSIRSIELFDNLYPMDNIPSFHSGKWRYQATNPGVSPKWAHLTEFLTLWELDYTFTKEGRDLKALYWLSRTKQNLYQEQVSDPIDWWPSGPTEGGQEFHPDWFEVYLSPGSNRAHKCVEDHVQIQGRPFWMVGLAFWVDKCPSNFYVANGWHIVALCQLVHGFLFGGHPHLQQGLGTELAIHSAGPSNPMENE